MKRLLFLLSMLVCAVLDAAAEQSIVTITTSKAYGDTFVFNPVPMASYRWIGETATK